MRVFLETSAFAKRYVAERGSDKVLRLCQQADSLAVSIICLPELISTLSRLVRERRLAQAAYRKLKSDVMADLADVDICQIAPEVLATVLALLESHSLRAMDALRVACALACEPAVFVSADHRQLSAARKSGLKVVDVS